MAQLLHAYRDDEQVVDIASVAYFHENIGQLSASQEELSTLLAMLLRSLPNAILLIDGIDECSNQADFFRILQNTALPSSDDPKPNRALCRLALFGRSSIRLPIRIEQASNQLRLSCLHNHEDIEVYSRRRIIELFDSGVMPEDGTVDDVVYRTVGRSNGMFLWVVLFLDISSAMD